MISPFKAVLGGDYKVVEKRLLARDPYPLRPAAGAGAPRSPKQIKAADRGAAYLEATRACGLQRKPRQSACSARIPACSEAMVGATI